jgi:hypothetical protein
MFLVALRQRIEFPIPPPPPEPLPRPLPRIYWIAFLLGLAALPVLVAGALGRIAWVSLLGFGILLGSHLFRLVFAWY